jgi:hypothetical protein
MTTNNDNVVEKFILEARNIGNMNGNSELASELLKEVASMNFSSSRGIEQVSAVIQEAEANLAIQLDEFAKYKIMKWMSRAFTNDDPRGKILSKEADRILGTLNLDEDDEKANLDMFAVAEDGIEEVVDSTSGVDLENDGRVVGSTSAETSSAPDQGTQRAGREVESSDEMDPMLLLFTMLDSQRESGKSLRDMLESMVSGRQSQAKTAAAKATVDSNKQDTLVTNLFEIIKTLLQKDRKASVLEEKDLDLPTKPKKYAPKMKDEESVMGFFSFFKSQAKSWGIAEDSKFLWITLNLLFRRIGNYERSTGLSRIDTQIGKQPKLCIG